MRNICVKLDICIFIVYVIKEQLNWIEVEILFSFWYWLENIFIIFFFRLFSCVEIFLYFDGRIFVKFYWVEYVIEIIGRFDMK